MGNYLSAFLVGGLICAIGQIFLDNTNFKPAHLLVGLVVLGSILTGFGLYEPLKEFAGAGVTIPVSSFGNILTQGVIEGISNEGAFGLFTGLLKTASAGIGASIIFGFFIALLFSPKA